MFFDNNNRYFLSRNTVDEVAKAIAGKVIEECGGGDDPWKSPSATRQTEEFFRELGYDSDEYIFDGEFQYWISKEGDDKRACGALPYVHLYVGGRMKRMFFDALMEIHNKHFSGFSLDIYVKDFLERVLEKIPPQDEGTEIYLVAAFNRYFY